MRARIITSRSILDGDGHVPNQGEGRQSPGCFSFFEEQFWVDTGACYTYIPEERLHEIGVRPVRTRGLILADGRVEHRLQGEATLTIFDLDESWTCPVVFAPPGSLYLLGATALENFGVQADPTTQQLKPVAIIIGGFRATRSP